MRRKNLGPVSFVFSLSLLLAMGALFAQRETTAQHDALVISVPTQAPDPVDAVVVLDIAGSPEITARDVREMEGGKMTLSSSRPGSGKRANPDSGLSHGK
jgi:hypothetical protein